MRELYSIVDHTVTSHNVRDKLVETVISLVGKLGVTAGLRYLASFLSL